MMTKNLQRFSAEERAAMRRTADAMRERPELL